jgi:3-(3-hydroxy-phenyl)propionate hydroxylase
MTADADADADVVIVGYGPVGTVLAVLLGRAGHAVTVIDKNTAPYPLPRAVTHDADVARILQDLGLPPDEIPDITEPYDDMYSWRNGDDEVLVDVDWSGVGESGWHNTWFFHQPALEKRLDSIVEGLPSVTVRRAVEAVGITQADGAVDVAVREGETESTLRARWVIGADGANSDVRAMVGVDRHDEGYFHDWLVVDVVPGDGVHFPHIARQHCDPRRPATMVPGGPGRRRWEFMRLPDETVEHLSDPATAWDLLSPFGLTAENAELERQSVYTFAACWATRWRVGRVFLAGDAAHLMPPFAGQGLGAGLRDAVNLAWKLDAVLRGIAGDDLLDTYESERLHHASEMVRFSVGLGKVICITNPEEAGRRDREMLAERRDPPPPPRPGLGPGLHEGDAGGRLARQGRVSVDGAGPRMLDDVLGGPGAVVGRTVDTVDAVAGRLDDLGLGCVALDGRPTPGVVVVDDVDDVLGPWLDDLDADVVLVRPDFFVFGAARGDGAARGLVDRFRVGVRGKQVSTTF